jgi:uncharacterized phage-associated protein
MQLQKLLYLVLSVHYFLWSRRAFKEHPHAYTNGPVFPNVEASYRSGPQVIAEALGGHAEKLSTELKTSVGFVLERFGEWTARDLERFTKQPHSPWKVTWGDRPADAKPPQAVIGPELIESWARRHGVSPALPDNSRSDRELLELIAKGDKRAFAKLLK